MKKEEINYDYKMGTIDQSIHDMKNQMNARFMQLEVKIDSLNKQIMGNGHKGILDRMTDLENMRVYVIGFMAAFLIVSSVLGVYVKGFIEQVYHHINH